MRSRAVRRVVIAALLSPALLGACVGDDPDLRGAGEDASADASSSKDVSDADAGASSDAKAASDSGDVGLSDATADADAEAGPACKPTPQGCKDPMQTCVNNCRVSYNVCKNNCAQDANLQNCINNCKSTLASCQVPCKSDCVTCANQNGSCTGNPDCSAIIYVE
jgi:hypothetical protein